LNISWVLADGVDLDPTQELEPLKQAGPFWGSWRTWRAYQTDNVICHDPAKVDELLNRAFQAACNFYISYATFQALDCPLGVKVYQGDFVHEVGHQEEIIAMHLAASVSDIVLLLGFDLQEQEKNPDKLTEHRAHVYRTMVKHVVEDNPEVQWVLVDHPGDIMKMLVNLPNLNKDTMDTALSLLDS
jgi:hypothetical protein